MRCDSLEATGKANSNHGHTFSRANTPQLLLLQSESKDSYKRGVSKHADPRQHNKLETMTTGATSTGF